MKKTKVAKVKVATTVKALVIHCGNLDKDVVVKASYWNAHSGECELCGSHGDVKVETEKCECGENHTIELYSW